MPQDVYLLPEDRDWAERRIVALTDEIQQLGPEFYDVFTQSSETWHDNAPFEAVRDRQSVLAAELHHLRTLIRHCTLMLPKKKRGTIGIGDTVILANGACYKIAGDWTHKAGHHSDGVTWVSRKTPVALAVLGKKLGDTVSFGQITTTIESII